MAFIQAGIRFLLLNTYTFLYKNKIHDVRLEVEATLLLSLRTFAHVAGLNKTKQEVWRPAKHTTERPPPSKTSHCKHLKGCSWI